MDSEQWCKNHNIDESGMIRTRENVENVMYQVALAGLPLYETDAASRKKDPRWYEKIRVCILAGNGQQVAVRAPLPAGAGMGALYRCQTTPNLLGKMASMQDQEGSLFIF